MRLWIDDIRPAPEGWVWVKNFDEAVKAFQEEEISDASFDYDLGYVIPEEDCHFDVGKVVKATAYDTQMPDGNDILTWVIENKKWPSESITVHSMNPTGAKRLCDTIERYGPYEYRERIIYEGPKNYKLRAVRYTKGEDYAIVLDEVSEVTHSSHLI